MSISREREDFAIVEGRLDPLGNCGTVAREGGGFFYVCDMPLVVERVVFGQWREPSVTARYFMGESDTPDDVYTGPHVRRDRRGAAILWRRDGVLGSYVLMDFPGRWCVPIWMVDEFNLIPDELSQLERAGYPLC